MKPERLSKKAKLPSIGYESYSLDFEKDGYEIANKLGPLEDIEDRLGIGVATIFNADEIWFVLNGMIRRATQTYVPRNLMFFFNREEIVIFGVKRNDIIAVCTWKGYGITWAFTKEELE